MSYGGHCRATPCAPALKGTCAESASGMPGGLCWHRRRGARATRADVLSLSTACLLDAAPFKPCAQASRPARGRWALSDDQVQGQRVGAGLSGIHAESARARARAWQACECARAGWDAVVGGDAPPVGACASNRQGPDCLSTPGGGKTEEHATRFVLLTFALKKTHNSREKVNGGRRRTGRRHSESAFYW